MIDGGYETDYLPLDKEINKSGSDMICVGFVRFLPDYSYTRMCCKIWRTESKRIESSR